MNKKTIFRQSYRVLTDDEKQMIADIKDQAAVMLDCIDVCPAVNRGREIDLAKTKLEEAVMWAVKAVTKFIY